MIWTSWAAFSFGQLFLWARFALLHITGRNRTNIGQHSSPPCQSTWQCMTSVCELNAHGNLYGNIYAATYGKYMSGNVQQGEDSFVRPQVMASCQEQVKALSLHHSHRGEHFHPAHQHSKSASASSPKMKPSACQSTFSVRKKLEEGRMRVLLIPVLATPIEGL